MATVTLVAAVAENGVIGRNGGLPWRLSSDLRRFKRDTMGKPIVMGRKTFESIGKALPGRANIVVTRDSGWRAENVLVADSLEAALKLAEDEVRKSGAAEICIIGGGEIFAEAMPLADRIRLTHVACAPEGDTRFPALDPLLWKAVASENASAGDKDSHKTRYVVYERAKASA